MSFLSPLFLIGALTAAVPILLHLLKRRPEPRVKFSAVKLLRDLPIEHTERRRFVDLLLLALRVAALLLLTMAFARPFMSGRASSASRVTVVALDTSLSMSPEVRFNRAQQLAKQAVDQVEPGGRVSILSFADGARVELEPTSDRALARATIDAAVPGFGATNYRAALNRATAVLAEGPGTIVVVTDLQESGWDAGGGVTVPVSADVRVADVGELPPNLALTAAKVSGERIVATVLNTGSQAREAHVRLTVDDGPGGGGKGVGGPATVAVGAGRSVDVSLPLVRGRFARVAVDDPDGIEGDNARYILLQGAAQPLVLVVTPTGELEQDAFYVQQALVASRSDGGGYRVEGIGAPRLAEWNQAQRDACRGLILLTTRGLDQRARALIAEYIRSGGGVLVAAGAGIDGDVLTETLGVGQVDLQSQERSRTQDKGRHIAPFDVRHPVFGSLTESSWGLVQFGRVATLGIAGCQAVARFTTGEPALVDCASGRGRVLVFASDLNNLWNDFPLHASFVPFIHRAMRYLSEGQKPSEYLVGEVPPGLAPRPGVTMMGGDPAGKPAEKLVAVNVDPRESDPRRLTEADFRATISRANMTSREARLDSARQIESRQQLWRYVLAVMLGALILEGVVAARTA